MSKLKQKSEFNFESAKLLIDNTYYASSVHCSYYSCFQLFKYTIKDFFGVDYETQSININSSSSIGSHNYVINYIIKELFTLDDKRTVVKIKRQMKDLKTYRTESDYFDVEVNIEQGNAALAIAKDIRKYMNDKF